MEWMQKSQSDIPKPGHNKIEIKCEKTCVFVIWVNVIIVKFHNVQHFHTQLIVDKRCKPACVHVQ